MSDNITLGVAILLMLNMVYVIYLFLFKKNYYENIFITTSIFISALIIHPINASFKFNAKYGFSIIDLGYYGIILYLILASVFRNNNFFMVNMPWDNFYKLVKEVFRKKGIDTHYRIPTIYIEDSKAKMELKINLCSKSVIIVKFTSLNEVIDISEFKKMLNKEIEISGDNEFKHAKYFYLAVNAVMTLLLLITLR